MKAMIKAIQQQANMALLRFAQSKGLSPENLPMVQVQIPPSDMNGHFTLVLFPFLSRLQTKPEELGTFLASELKSNGIPLQASEVLKGFLNVRLETDYWLATLDSMLLNPFSKRNAGSSEKAILIEFPSPNTNKPLHLGHLRNIFLGSSLALILEEVGCKVVRTNLYNDRGTNISKSMAAWLNSTDKMSPESSGMKGDHLVGHYYVQYANALKKQIQELVDAGMDPERAAKESALARQVEALTLAWEANEVEVRALWEKMNGWFYQGAEQTFERLGVRFDQVYKESEVYDLGRQTVAKGLETGVFYEKEDSSVWINLEDIGLDHKLVLRSNGTTVYITQDLALAYQKARDFGAEHSIYVVGNEQDYHFKVLFEILRRLGLAQPEGLFHLSYGMVELPSGKMKSREGTVVDADDLLDELKELARQKADEQGRLNHLDAKEQEQTWEAIGQSALRYFMLRVDPKKRMVFNPEESIDFQGDTGPFLQYIHARCASLMRNASSMGLVAGPVSGLGYEPDEAELNLIRKMQEWEGVLDQAAREYSPAVLAHFVYELASAYSGFYHGHPVLAETQPETRQFRLSLTAAVKGCLARGIGLLGIEPLERM